MSRLSFQELKAKFKQQETEKQDRKDGKKTFKKNSNIWPFWTMNAGEQAVVRLIPDKNEDNDDVFFATSLQHTLAIDGKDVKVTCLKTYGEACPICAMSVKYYASYEKTKNPKDQAKGKYFYRKKVSPLRVLVLEDPLPPDPETKEKCTGKVMPTQFSFQLIEKIKFQIANDLENEPWDFEKGHDFKIVKNHQGKDENGKDQFTYAIGSGFAHKATAIPPDLLAKIELVDLKTLLPPNPGLEKVEQLLNAHLTGGSLSTVGTPSTPSDEGLETDEDVETEKVLNAAATANNESADSATDLSGAVPTGDPEIDAVLEKIMKRRLLERPSGN